MTARTASVVTIAMALWCALFALTASDSHAATRPAHCVAQGRAVTVAQGDAPDFSARLSRGDSVTLTTRDAFALTEVHAYPTGGGASRQYRCTARHGVDIFDEWRTRSGRIVATFDGVTFRAHARAIVRGWEA